jgi:antitoxin Phd
LSAIDKYLDLPARITRLGKEVAQVIDPSSYEKLIAVQEELDDIAAFDAAIEDQTPNVPWAQIKKDRPLN